MLGVSAILQHRNGAVADGLMLWRKNVDGEFAGVEPCPICYLVIHGTNHQRRLRCHKKETSFHGVPVQVVHQLEQEHVSAVPDAVGGELSRVSRAIPRASYGSKSSPATSYFYW